jgi:hypothetical protein
MTSLNLRIQLPHAGEGRFTPLLIALECLTRINQWHFQRGAAVSLKDSKAIYKEEAPGKEDWNDALTVASQGYGDCEDLAAYLCAELRELHGVNATCVIRQKFFTPAMLRSAGYPVVPRDGFFLVHCLVRLPDGRVLDPSKTLGMRGDY